MKAKKSVNARITCGRKVRRGKRKKETVKLGGTLYGITMEQGKQKKGRNMDSTVTTSLTTWRWRSFSVLWLYQGSSRSGDHCQAYLRTVLITALLIRMHRYTMRKAFMDLRGTGGEAAG